MMTTNQIDVLRKPDPSKFFLKWNDFESQILTGFSQLYVSKSLADVTLVCEGTSIKAHKLVLSMYSPYLRMILTEAHGKHPVVTIDGVKARDLINVLEFLYLGKVCVKHEDIESFVETARFLNIDGIQGEKKSNMQYVRDADCLPKPDVPAPWSGHAMSPATSRPPSSWMNYGNKATNLVPPAPPSLPPAMSITSEPQSFQPKVVHHQRPSILPPGQSSAVSSIQEQSLCPVNYVRSLQTMNPFAQKSIADYYAGGSIIQEIGPSSPGRCSDASNDEPIDMQIKPNKSPETNNSPSEAPSSSQSKQAPSKDIELFTTPSGMIVSTAFNKKQGRWHGMPHPSAPSFMPHRRFYPSSSVTEFVTRSLNIPVSSSPVITPDPLCLTSKQILNDGEAISSASSSVSGTSATDILKGSSSLHYNKSIKYTPSQVRALVQSVDGLSGPFVPCKICQKVVKRERLRTHIYECHLVNGEKITCQYCGVALKSKGSYRVHVWRHRNGNLKKNKVKVGVRSASE